MSCPFSPLVAPSEPPTLDPGIIEDDEALAEIVDAFIHADPTAREQLAEVGLYTEAVRRAVDADTWQAVLRVDELATARWTDLAVNIARWAFDAGRRHPLQPGEGS